jgi:hypothetical protein
MTGSLRLTSASNDKVSDITRTVPRLVPTHKHGPVYVSITQKKFHIIKPSFKIKSYTLRWRPGNFIVESYLSSKFKLKLSAFAKWKPRSVDWLLTSQDACCNCETGIIASPLHSQTFSTSPYLLQRLWAAMLDYTATVWKLRITAHTHTNTTVRSIHAIIVSRIQ